MKLIETIKKERVLLIRDSRKMTWNQSEKRWEVRSRENHDLIALEKSFEICFEYLVGKR